MSNNLGSALTAGGGITGPQGALANWKTAEDEIKNAGAFGLSGMPMSTGLTQADAGSAALGALEASQQSQQDAAAQAAFINNQFNQLAGGLGSALGGLGGKQGGGGNSQVV